MIKIKKTVSLLCVALTAPLLALTATSCGKQESFKLGEIVRHGPEDLKSVYTYDFDAFLVEERYSAFYGALDIEYVRSTEPSTLGIKRTRTYKVEFAGEKFYFIIAPLVDGRVYIEDKNFLDPDYKYFISITTVELSRIPA